MDENKVAVIYFGDETDFRQKQCGLRLIDQLFLSIRSLRNNWSKSVDVLFFHSRILSSSTLNKLKELDVKVTHCPKVIEIDFPLSNKILVGDAYDGSKSILFLDCDTIIHKGIKIDTDKEMYVAYDAVKNIDLKSYKRVLDYLQMELPQGEIYESPAFEYYYHNTITQFPVFNSGVFFLRKDLQHIFYDEYKKIFLALYNKFSDDKWRFYIEQIAFCMSAIKLKINYSIFPKGYNFICTPRADFLKDWNTDEIVIEHYAGDNGRPIKL